MVAPSVRGNTWDSITSRLVRFCLPVVLGLALVVDVRGQFTSGVQAVEVYASVVDRDGAPVRGLTKEDFELLEDGQPQALSAFAAGDFPLTVALAVDHSFSMAGPMLSASKSATRAFLNALRPADESLVVGIGSRVTIIGGTDVSRSEQIDTVNRLTAWGTTTLHDAILASIGQVDAARGRRALIVLSDGDDRYSTASAGDTLDRARRSNVMIYPIALGRQRPPLFAEIATMTGGRSYHQRDLKGLDTLVVTIAAQLHEQYLLGYSPSRPPVPGKNEWRSITVRVKKPGVTVRARDGYFTK